MITEFGLENWKSYSSAIFHIDPISVLIGTNSSGKSNALDALILLNRIASGATLTSALSGDAALQPLRGGVEWAARRPFQVFAVTVTCRLDDQTDYEYRIECRILEKHCEIESERLTRKKYRLVRGGARKEVGKIILFSTEPCEKGSPIMNARLYNGKRGTPRQVGRTQPVLVQISAQKIPQEVLEGVTELLHSLRGIFVLDPIPSHMRDYSPLAEQLDPDARNIAGVIAALPESEKGQIEEIITKYAHQLPEGDVHRVFAETVGRFHSDAMLYSEELWKESDPPTIDARGMSDGTLRFLAILTALLTRPLGSLLVVEEVDNGLHPSRAHLLLKMLRDVGEQRQIDVLVTTHNPALMNAMGPEMVPFITVAHRNFDNGASELTLMESLEVLPKLLAQGPVGTLSSNGMIEKSFRSLSRREPQMVLPRV